MQPVDIDFGDGFNLLLIAACQKNHVGIHWSQGLLAVQLEGLGKVLGDLPETCQITGFEAFQLEGYSIVCPLEITAFDSGRSPREVIPALEILLDGSQW